MLRQIILLLTLFLGIKSSYSQFETPRNSPKASISQLIGVCKFTVDYCRPSVKGRKIFGELVSYDKVWRAGADEATTITFNHEIEIYGNKIEPGKYGLFIIPTQNKWTVIFNKEWNQWGAYNYDEKEDILRIEVQPNKIPKKELCTFSFTNVSKTLGHLNLGWDTTSISIPITTDTYKHTELEIENLIARKSDNWFEYSAAAQYYFYERKNGVKAIEIIDIAIKLDAPNPAPWMLKSQILASQKNYTDAIKNAESALEIAKIHDFWYEIEENEHQIKKWKALLGN